MSNIYYTVEWTINDGQLAPFEDLLGQCNVKVHENEPKMLDYRWYCNEDKSVFYLRERHTDSESLMFHLDNIGELLGKLLEVTKITRFEVFGDPNDTVRETFEGLAGQLGIEIPMLVQHSGFTR